MPNSITITGNLVADPEFSETKGGQEMCQFRMADDDYGRDAQFWKLVAFDESPMRVLRKAKKGSSVQVMGTLKAWKDDDGKWRQSSGNAFSVTFLGGKKQEDNNKGQGRGDDLPF